MISTATGTLERVEPCEIWSARTEDFTQWLAAPPNLRLLSETLQTELTAEDEPAGPGALVCREASSERRTLILCDLSGTHDARLGALLANAARLDATRLVWVTDHFSERHRTSLGWLAQHSGEELQFVGLELELWRIGDSPLAPAFRPVTRLRPRPAATVEIPAATADAQATSAVNTQRLHRLPHEKTLQAASNRPLSTPPAAPQEQEQEKNFWLAFHRFVRERSNRLRSEAVVHDHWISFPLGRPGFQLRASATAVDGAGPDLSQGGTHELRAELVLDGADATTHFARLLSQRSSLEIELGESLSWYGPGEARLKRVYATRTIHLAEASETPALHTWLLQKLEALHRLFAPRIAQMAPGREAPITRIARSSGSPRTEAGTDQGRERRRPSLW